MLARREKDVLICHLSLSRCIRNTHIAGLCKIQKFRIGLHSIHESWLAVKSNIFI